MISGRSGKSFCTYGEKEKIKKNEK